MKILLLESKELIALQLVEVLAEISDEYDVVDVTDPVIMERYLEGAAQGTFDFDVCICDHLFDGKPIGTHFAIAAKELGLHVITYSEYLMEPLKRRGDELKMQQLMEHACAASENTDRNLGLDFYNKYTDLYGLVKRIQEIKRLDECTSEQNQEVGEDIH